MTYFVDALLIIACCLMIFMCSAASTYFIIWSIKDYRIAKLAKLSIKHNQKPWCRYSTDNLAEFYERNKEKLEKHADELSTEAPCLFSNFPLREDSAKERENKLEENDATEKKEYENVRIELSEDEQEQDKPSPESEVAE